jgi:hypothetical protein
VRFLFPLSRSTRRDELREHVVVDAVTEAVQQLLGQLASRLTP